MRNRFTRPSPALVISIIALFVALGGTGYAAVQLPRASVGAKHLKKNSVSSAKVKNSSLRIGDFKASERSKLHGAAGARGLPGARGLEGLRGLTGLRGLAGAQGAQGSAGTNGTDGDPGSQGIPGVPGGDGDPGSQGIPGTDGADGDPGSQGIPGPTGVEQVVVRTAALTYVAATGPNGQVLSDNVQCQPAESVVGGGADIGPFVAFENQLNVSITASRPADAAGSALASGSEPRGWFIAARRNSNTATQTVTIYVLCASAGA